MPLRRLPVLACVTGLVVAGAAGSAQACSVRVGPGDAVADAVAAASDGAMVCLRPGRYGVVRLAALRHGRPVTLTRAPGVRRADVRVAGVRLERVRGLTVRGLTLTDRVSVVQAGADITIDGNDIVGLADGGAATAGVYLYGWTREARGVVSRVRITGNEIHGMTWPTGETGGPGDGYGIVMAGHHRDITIAGNTIRGIAVDAIQSSGGDRLAVESNRFLGPGHDAMGHAGVHADLWQVFGDADGLRFTGNTVVGTGTDESLLFQSGRLRDVVVADNRFDRDSTGYSAQIWPVDGLTLRDNTFVGSRWGVALRSPGLGTLAAGRGYRVSGNVVSSAEGPGLALGAGVADWGVFSGNRVGAAG